VGANVVRVLFVVPYVPSRIRVRPFEFIRTLARHHHVEVVCLVSNDDEAADLPALEEVCAGVHPVPHPPLRAMMRAIRAGMTSEPFQAAYAASSDLKRAVERIVARFDIVHIEHLRGAATPFETGGVPVVWDAVDCISLLLAEMARAPQKAYVRAVRAIDSSRTRQYEARLLQRFSHTVVTSARDAAALWDLRPETDTTITIIPNGVDLAYFQPQPTPRAPHEVIFTGKMSYHANHTAVRSFVTHVWPSVRAALPDARLMVVGSNPPRDIRNLDGIAGITVTGRVPDMRPYLARAAVAVAPLVYGVGNPNKVLEAMAMALPVVATPPAVTAICAGAGDGVLTAERDAMARTLVHILENPADGARLGQEGRRYVEMHHTWSRAAGQLAEVYGAAHGGWATEMQMAAFAAD
jgi:sugar transferase (PEP-CTERM/EpsH1 system associated)